MKNRRRLYAVLAGLAIVGGAVLLLLRPDLAGRSWAPLLLILAAALAGLAVMDGRQ